MAESILSLNLADLIGRIVTIGLNTYAIWLPIFLIVTFFNLWMAYIRGTYIKEQEVVLLEIKVPKEITKSPLAMEIFLTALWQKGAATLIETYWGGKVRPWFSLEMASFDGNVHFYIWTWQKYQSLVETQLYSQYPNVEIVVVEDYADKIPYDIENYPFWATYFKLTDPDVYPIKTYIDYGLEKDPKEEFKIDPLTSVIEYLGSLGKGEQAWIQIIIQAHTNESFGEGRIFVKKDWKDAAKNEIEKIRKEAMVTTSPQGTPILALTKGQELKITAIERSLEKWPFEACIRGFYIAHKDSNKISTRISGLIGAFRQYSSNNLNGIKLGKFTDFDYPWQDFQRMRRTATEKGMLDAYKKRSFFWPPYQFYRAVPIILTTEELATIYHFPGEVASTPTFERIVSRKAKPPANLPV